MIVAVCTLELEIPSSHSLKDKRRVVKSVIARVRKDFNLSVAEVDSLDQWQYATLGLVCVSSDRDYAHGMLEKAVASIDRARLDAVIGDYSIEIL